ncbi:MAG TPA: hypothetical protein DCS63_05635 [Elusimicrobia bacterium]|nr:hypothetical protein [Elusimicrobiota bacterium]
MAADASRGDAAAGGPPVFALPGVPLKTEQMGELPAPQAEEMNAADPAVPPVEAAPAETAPTAAAPAPGKDLDFHLAAANKYSAKKKYRSAAAEYGAALGFLTAGDARAVRLLERQGAMLLRAGDGAGAQGHFLAAIGKAKELNVSGKDLAAAHLGLGYCLEKVNNIPDAIINYEKALQLSSGKTIKARIAKTISDLKKAP